MILKDSRSAGIRMSNKFIPNQSQKRNVQRKSTKPKRNAYRKPKQPRAPVRSSGISDLSAYSTHIRGSEIVHQMTTVPLGTSFFTTIIPCNPRYSPSAIRLYNIARSYQTYRPVQLSLEWHPTVNVTTSGASVMGTQWQTQYDGDTVISSLSVSNGGIQSAVYTPSISRPQLTGRLTQNWYYMHDLTEDCNPFNFVVVNTVAASGYYVLKYHYIFNNPTTQFFSISKTSDASKDLTTLPDGTMCVLKAPYTAKNNSTATDTVLETGTLLTIDTVINSAGAVAKVLRAFGEIYYLGTVVVADLIYFFRQIS